MIIDNSMNDKLSVPHSLRIKATWLLASFLVSASLVTADEIVLRNFSKIEKATVSTFDADGLLLSDGRLLTFDVINSAKVVEQKKFDELHSKIGIPLFRLRIRLKKKDYENLGSLLSELYPIYQNRQSKTAMLVHIAQFRDAIESGKNSIAIRSFFYLIKLTNGDTARLKYLRELGFDFELATGLSKWLPVLEVDRKTVVENWDSISAAYRSLPAPHPSGLDFYFFGIADLAEIKLSAEIRSARLKLNEFEQTILSISRLLGRQTDKAKISQADVDASIKKLSALGLSTEASPIRKATGLYYLGRLQLLSDRADGSNGLLNLLRIHAESVIPRQRFQLRLYLRLRPTWSNGSRQKMRKMFVKNYYRVIRRLFLQNVLE